MNAWRMFAFLLFALCVWGSAHLYMGRRLIRASRLQDPWRRAAWAAMIVLGALPLLALPTRWLGEGPALDALHWAGFTVGGFSSVLFVFVLAVDLVRLAVWLLRRARRWWTPDAGPPSLGVRRTRLLGQLLSVGLVGGATVLTAVGLIEALRPPRVVKVDVPIEGLPAALHGFRIVQLTDLHLGPILGRRDLDDLVERANRLEADVVAVTGDLVDGDVDDLRHDVAPLARLRARHGAFFVTGNHEYYSNALEWCPEIERLGLTLLLNEHRVLEHDGGRVLLAGVTDHRAGNRIPGHASDPAAAIASATASDVELLLAHQPRSAFAAERAGFDLQISGHTHGGQYFPVNVVAYLVQPFFRGLYRHQSMWIYVSSGTGFWGPPLRAGVPAEITVIRLVRGD
jgi:predicted MPP superfamily phosphohydrolase